jgi:hypothetical protein
LSAVDNCDADVKISFSEQRNDDADEDNYILTRTWSATDACGNTASHTQQVTVYDSLGPTMSEEPADATFSCDAVQSAPHVAVRDNCDESVDVQLFEATISGNCANDYTILRTWSSVDRSGNQGSYTQTVSVEDKEAPTSTSTDAVACLSPADDTYAVFAQASRTITRQVGDNCGSSTNSLVGCSSDADDGEQFGDFTDDCYYDSAADKLYVRAGYGGLTERTYTVQVSATDECGNSDTVSVTIVVPAEEADDADDAGDSVRRLMAGRDNSGGNRGSSGQCVAGSNNNHP